MRRSRKIRASQRRAGRRLLALLGLTLASGCSIDLGTADRLPTFLETEWQGATSDTIDALIQGAVIAQVIDQDGRPMSGRFITFTTLPTEEVGRPGVLLGQEGFAPNEPSVRVLSDFSGISVAQVRLGTLVGRTGIVVTVFELEEADTVYVDVLPGQLHQVVFEPGDTTISAGSAFQATIQPADFYKNPLAMDIEITGTGAVTAEPSGEGALITGITAGTGIVRAVAGPVTDSIVVQVTAGSGGA